MRDRDSLHAFQVEAIRELVARKEVMLWAGLGAGKTVIALTAILDLNMSALVVGTKRIVERTWPNEIAQWAHLQNLSYASATGPKRLREKAVKSNPRILGVNYETLKWLYQNGYEKGRQILILDEACMMKSHSTIRFRAHAKRLGGFERRYAMTATPASESYLDLWGQVASTIESRPLGRTITEFRSTYTKEDFRLHYTRYSIDRLGEDKIRRAIRPWVVTVDDATLKRPEPTYIDQLVPWTTTGSRSRYKEMERDLVVALRTQPISAASKGVAFNKCRQLASGFIYDNDGTAHGVDEDKMSAILETYGEVGAEPVLLFYQFKWERDYLMGAIKGAEEPTPEALARWDSGKVPALIAHPASAGRGLNLQGPCRHLFWVSLPWSLRQYLQGNGRIDRQGQKRQVVITRFMRENSIEQDVLGRLQGKWERESELIERIQERNDHEN